MGLVRGVAVDSKFVYLSAGNCVFKIDSSGTLTRIAGNGRPGLAGDGGPGVDAELLVPGQLALDGGGNLYIADTGNRVVRKLAANGTISTVPGTALSPGPGLSPSYYGVALGASGNIYIADAISDTVWRVSPSGQIAAFAGNGSGTDSGDDGPATLAGVTQPMAVAVDTNQNVFIAEPAAIRKVAPDGTITTVAGTATSGSSGDGGPATNAQLGNVDSLAVDSSGALYIGEPWDIRMVSSSGTITTVAGSYALGGSSTGDGGPPSSAGFYEVRGLALAGNGELYIADQGRVRQISDNIIQTIEGAGVAYTGDGGPATFAQLSPSGIQFDSEGNLYIADNGSRIRKVTPDGLISTYAGGAVFGDSGDGGPATDAQLLLYPLTGMAFDSSGSLYVVEQVFADIRKITSDGVISTFVTLPGQLGRGFPNGLAIDSAGNLFLADTDYSQILKIDPNGNITTFAASDGSGPEPYALAIDSANNLFASLYFNNGITEYSPSGTPTNLDPSVTGGPMAMDPAGAIYAFEGGALVRIARDGTTTTVATGSYYYPTEGAPGTNGVYINATAIAVDSSGNVYVADSGAGAVFKLSQAPPPSTISRTFVSTIGSDANASENCSAIANCRTLSAALAHTSPGGEVVIVESGGYGPLTISQPVAIIAAGVTASISAGSGANAVTVNTTGSVTLAGVNLHGQGSGLYGILVQQVGFLRLYNMLIENFTVDGLHFTAGGNLSVYDSMFNDNGHDGIFVGNASANAYVSDCSVDGNLNAGVEVSVGQASVTDSSAHHNLSGFLADGGTLALSGDLAIFNGTGLASSTGGTLYFARCLISNNTTAYNVGVGSAMSGSNPATSLIAPGQATEGALSAAPALQ